MLSKSNSKYLFVAAEGRRNTLCISRPTTKKNEYFVAFGTFAYAVSSLWCHLTTHFVPCTHSWGGAATFGKVFQELGQKNTPYNLYGVFFYPSDFLLSQAAARQVSSALQSLTTVFGMGTGVSSASSSLSRSKCINIQNRFGLRFLHHSFIKKTCKCN